MGKKDERPTRGGGKREIAKTGGVILGNTALLKGTKEDLEGGKRCQGTFQRSRAHSQQFYQRKLWQVKRGKFYERGWDFGIRPERVKRKRR